MKVSGRLCRCFPSNAVHTANDILLEHNDSE